MKTLTTVALGLAALLAGLVAVHAQTAEPAVPYHHYHVHHFQGPHHAVHHRFVGHNPPPAVAPVVVAPPPAGPFGLAFPHIAPYPDGKGDEDGLSEDINDCNKGCIDGAEN